MQNTLLRLAANHCELFHNFICPRKIEIKRDATDIWWLALIDTGRLFVTPCQSVWLMDWATRKIPEWILSPLASTKAVSDREIRMFLFQTNGVGEAMLPQMIDVELKILHKASPYIDSQQTKPNKNNMDGN